MEFITENYVWFIVGGVIIIMAVIGYFADKSNFGKKKTDTEVIEEPKKEKAKKIKEEKPAKIEVDAKGIGELSQSVIENNLKEQQNIDTIKENNENIDQDLFAPLQDSDLEKNDKNNDVTNVQEVIENNNDESKTIQDLRPIEPTKLEMSNDSNDNKNSDDDDIWKF